METTAKQPTSQPENAASKRKIKSVALPVEHGGWGFLTEPILLGLLIAPSWSGLLLGIAAFGVFLIRHPLKLVAKDRQKGRRFERTKLAERFVLIYVLWGLIGFLIVAANNEATFITPILIAAPMILIQLAYDIRNKSRELIAELAGATALGASAPAIAILGGYDLRPAIILWILLTARTIPSILYVRARIRLEFNRPFSPIPSWITHVASVVIVAAIALNGEGTALAIGMMLLLLGRMALGLSERRKQVAVKVIGFQEMGYGFLTVFVFALGYWFGI